MERPRDKESPDSPAGNPRSATGEFASVIASATPQDLVALLRGSRFDEAHLLLLLSRSDLPVTVLDEIGKRREFLKSARVLYALASHPHVSHSLALRLLRNLYVMDLAKLSVTPAVSPPIRVAADEVVIARLPQIPLGQKIALARIASARVLAELLIQGHARIVGIALDNSRLTEASVVNLLSHGKIGAATLPAIWSHPRWTRLPNIRLALLQRDEVPESIASKFLAACSPGELKILFESTRISHALRREISEKLARRD
jgi:hypothetical protein